MLSSFNHAHGTFFFFFLREQNGLFCELCDLCAVFQDFFSNFSPPNMSNYIFSCIKNYIINILFIIISTYHVENPKINKDKIKNKTICVL